MDRSALKRLPPELRQEVYRHLSGSRKVYIDPVGLPGPDATANEWRVTVHKDDRYGHLLALMYTCKQLYLEAQPFLAQRVLAETYSVNALHGDDFPAWLQQLPEDHPVFSRSIEVRFTPLCGRWELDKLAVATSIYERYKIITRGFDRSRQRIALVMSDISLPSHSAVPIETSLQPARKIDTAMSNSAMVGPEVQDFVSRCRQSSPDPALCRLLDALENIARLRAS